MRPVIPLWPSYLYPTRLTATSSTDPRLSRLLVADVVARESRDEPMPGCAPATLSLPFTT